MVVEELSSKIVFLDTAPLIYFMEGHSRYQKTLFRIFDLNDKGGFSFVTTSITLLEVLVKPLREDKLLLDRQYRDILMKAPGIEILDVTSLIAERAALLRAKNNLSTPDSIQIAAAIENRCDYFLTNDVKLHAITEIKIVTLSEIE